MSTDAALAESSTGDVGAILDERNGMRARNFRERVEIGERRAVVNGDDRLGAARDQPLDAVRIDACVGGADVCKDRTRHACDGSVRGRGESHRGNDDLIAGADAVVLVTEWAEFLALDWSAVAEAMAGNVVIDGRNALDSAAVRAAGLTYDGIGIG